MAAGSFPLIGDYAIEAGDTYDVTIPLVDGSGTPLVFTGFAVARMMLRATVDDLVSPFITLAVQDDDDADGGHPGIVIGAAGEDTPAGSIRITIDAAQTATLSFNSVPLTNQRSGVYDLEIVNTTPSPDLVWRLLQGAYLVDPEVTR